MLLGGQANPAAQRSVPLDSSDSRLRAGPRHDALRTSRQNPVDRLVVTVRNGNAPFALTLRPDGTLAGSGTVDVAGRLVTGFGDTGVTFAPHTERCAVSTLAATQ